MGPREQAQEVRAAVQHRWPGDLTDVPLEELAGLQWAERRELALWCISRLRATTSEDEGRMLRDLDRILTALGPDLDVDDALTELQQRVDAAGDPADQALVRDIVQRHGSLHAQRPAPAPSMSPPVAAPGPGTSSVEDEGTLRSHIRDAMSSWRKGRKGRSTRPEVGESTGVLGGGQGARSASPMHDPTPMGWNVDLPGADELPEDTTLSDEYSAEGEAQPAEAEPTKGEAPQGEDAECSEPEPGPSPVEAHPEPPSGRRWTFEIEDQPEGTPLKNNEQYTLAIGVDVHVPADTAFITTAPVDETLFATQPETDVFELTIMVSSADAEILSQPPVRPLRLPREGRSLGHARFDLKPLHDGICTITVTVDLAGNFITQFDLELPVGEQTRGVARAALTPVGRPPDSAATLEPRDISLVIKPAPPGYDCVALAGQHTNVHLPITDEELTFAVGALRKALLDVGALTDTSYNKVFQAGTTVPEDVSAVALRTLARAGARMFQQLFFHPEANQATRDLGNWIRTQASEPNVQLTVQFVAADVPVPWSLLYLGDASEGSPLDWSHFLGLRHIVEQLPYSSDLGSVVNDIDSRPELTVGLNINGTIDQQFHVTWVAEHVQRWQQLASARHGLNLLTRTSRADVLTALRKPVDGDRIVYFFCHASAAGASGNPDDAALVMGLPTDTLRLCDLNLDAPTETKLPEHPLVFINACESAELSPLFYAGFVPYFMAKGARGVIGTEANTPVVFATAFAEALLDRLLAGSPLGQAVLDTRREFVDRDHNPLGLLYAVYCDADTRISPALATT